MAKKQRFHTNVGRKPLNFYNDPLNISLKEEDMYVAFSWYSVEMKDLFEDNYGTMMLSQVNSMVDIKNKNSSVSLTNTFELVK